LFSFRFLGSEKTSNIQSILQDAGVILVFGVDWILFNIET